VVRGVAVRSVFVKLKSIGNRGVVEIQFAVLAFLLAMTLRSRTLFRYTKILLCQMGEDRQTVGVQKAVYRVSAEGTTLTMAKYNCGRSVVVAGAVVRTRLRHAVKRLTILEEFFC